MNEVYDALASFLEELRCDSTDRQYAVKTEDMLIAEEQLKEKHKSFELYLKSLQESDRIIVDAYIVAVDSAHFKEEQRAYYQGIMDGVQILGGLGLIKESKSAEMLLKRMKE